MPGLLSLLGITEQSFVSTVGFKVKNVPLSARNQPLFSLGAVEKGKWLLCPLGCIDFEEAVIYLNFAEMPPLSELLQEKSHFASSAFSMRKELPKVKWEEQEQKNRKHWAGCFFPSARSLSPVPARAVPGVCRDLSSPWCLGSGGCRGPGQVLFGVLSTFLE